MIPKQERPFMYNILIWRGAEFVIYFQRSKLKKRKIVKREFFLTTPEPSITSTFSLWPHEIYKPIQKHRIAAFVKKEHDSSDWNVFGFTFRGKWQSVFLHFLGWADYGLMFVYPNQNFLALPKQRQEALPGKQNLLNWRWKHSWESRHAKLSFISWS